MSVSPGVNMTPHCGSVSLLRAGRIGDEGTDSCEIRRQADGQATHTAAVFPLKTVHHTPDCGHAHTVMQLLVPARSLNIFDMTTGTPCSTPPWKTGREAQ